MSNLPAVSTPALPALYDRVDVSEIQLPNMYLAQGLTKAVENGLAKPGDAFIGLGASDADPVFLIGGTGKKQREYVTGYILRRTVSQARDLPSGMEWMTADEYDAAQAAREADVWKVYTYLVAIPEVDPIIPAKLMLWKTGGLIPAKQINFFIQKAMVNGETDPVCVKFARALVTGKKSGKQYWQWQPTLGTPTPDGLAAARQMLGFSLPNPEENSAPAETADQPGF